MATRKKFEGGCGLSWRVRIAEQQVRLSVCVLKLCLLIFLLMCVGVGVWVWLKPLLVDFFVDLSVDLFFFDFSVGNVFQYFA